MTKVYCGDTICKFNNDGVCTQRKIALSWHSVMTLHEGRQEFNRCKSYEMNERYRRIAQALEVFNIDIEDRARNSR